MENIATIINNLVNIISSVTAEPKETVYNRLLDEMLLLGTNVTRDIYRLGIKPHHYSNILEEYYKENDSFLYELIIYHLTPQRQCLSDKLLKISNDYKLSGRLSNCSVLCLGDGIGMDTLSFLTNGFDVTYFDFPSKSYDFAEILWKNNGVNPRVINDPNKIPYSFYDIVINIDVLEHVQNPEQIITNIGYYLKSDGIAIILASFAAISPNLPTHLFENLKYWGRMIDLFRKNNMIISALSEQGGNPLVFKKISNLMKLRKELFKTYFDKQCIKVRLEEYLNKVRKYRVKQKNQENINRPDYLSSIICKNMTSFLYLEDKCKR